MGLWAYSLWLNILKPKGGKETREKRPHSFWAPEYKLCRTAGSGPTGGGSGRGDKQLIRTGLLSGGERARHASHPICSLVKMASFLSLRVFQGNGSLTQSSFSQRKEATGVSFHHTPAPNPCPRQDIQASRRSDFPEDFWGRGKAA